MPEAVVLVAREGGVATLTLNRPEALNALNRELTLALLAQSAAEPDFREGLAAFLEKRKPQFKGR